MTAELVRANVDVIAAPIAISQSPLLRADEVIQ